MGQFSEFMAQFFLNMTLSLSIVMDRVRLHLPDARSIMRYILTLLPLPLWIVTYQLSWLLPDLVAGLTVALVLIPQSLAFGTLARLSPAHGLYSAFVGMLVYWLFGTSKDIAISATGISSMFIAGILRGVADMAGRGMYTPEEVALAITILCGIIVAGLGALRLGFIAEFISPVAVNAFSTAAMIRLILGQLPILLGLLNVGTRGRPYLVLFEIIRNIPHARVDAAFGIITLVVIVTLGRLCMLMAKWHPDRKRLWAFVSTLRLPTTITLMTLISYLINRHSLSSSFRIVGMVDSGFQRVQVPALPDAKLFKFFMPELPVIVIVMVVGQMAMAQQMADLNHYTVSVSKELIALGAVNIFCPFAGGYLSMGSFGASAILSKSGSRSPLAGAFAALILFLVITYLIHALSYTPLASLAGLIVYSMSSSLPKPRTLYKKFRYEPVESLIWAICLVTGLTFSLEWSLYLGITLVPLVHLWRFGRISDLQTEPYPGVFIYRFTESLALFNQSHHMRILSKHIRKNTKRPAESTDDTLEDEASLPYLRAIVLDFNDVKNVDSKSVEGLMRLRDAMARYAEPGIVEWHIANVNNGRTRRALEAAGFSSESTHGSILDAIDIATRNAREKDMKLVV